MKIYIMTDMEGISGICNYEQTNNENPLYEPARSLLCADVNAAIDGAFAGGATEVLVCDGHSSGFNFLLDQMDTRAIYERPNGRFDYLPGLDDSFDGVLCVGYHAKAGTLNGFIDHTQSFEVYHYKLNGKSTGELGQVALWAGSYDVPLLMVTGDQAACDEAKDFFGDIETVAVKQGIGWSYARCKHPEVAREEIRAAAERAIKLIPVTKPYKIESPITIRLEYVRSKVADATIRPGMKRIDSRTIECVVEHPRQILTIC